MPLTVRALALVMVLAVAGCETPPAPAPVHLYPTTSGDQGQGACHALTGLGPTEYDPVPNTTVGRMAAAAPTPQIADAGRILTDAAAAAAASPGPPATLTIIKAQVGLADACARTFGDGPW